MQAKDNFCCQVANLALLIAHTPSCCSAAEPHNLSCKVLFTACKEIRWLHFARAVWIIIKLPHIHRCSRSLSWWITLINYRIASNSQHWACMYTSIHSGGGRRWPVRNASCDTFAFNYLRFAAHCNIVLATGCTQKSECAFRSNRDAVCFC